MDKTKNVKQFPHDAECLLKEVGLSKFNVFSDDKRPHCPHCRGNSSMYWNEEEILKRLFTPDAARALIKRLHIDYDTFGFPEEPEWVATATGEWYTDKAPSNLRQIWNERKYWQGD